MGLPKIKVKRNTKTLFPFPCPEICLCWCSLLGIYTPIWGFGSHLKYLPQSVCVWGFKGFSSRSQSCCCSGHVGRPNKSFELVRPSVKVLTHPQPCKPDHNSRSGSCGGRGIYINNEKCFLVCFAKGMGMGACLQVTLICIEILPVTQNNSFHLAYILIGVELKARLKAMEKDI